VILEIDPQDPEPWLVARASDVVAKGGVAVIPTDTVYGLACDITKPEAISKIYALKDLDPKKPLSLLVGSMATVGHYAKGVTTPAFRMMRRVLPGPYTFIFNASSEVPKIMLRKRKTIGIRMPDNPIILSMLAELEFPMLTTSIRTPDDDFINDPTVIEEIYGSKVELVVDGGPLLPHPSTVVDLSGPQPELLREGKGNVDVLELF